MNSHARIAIAGGGTGGHVTMALALGEAFAAQGVEPIFFGSARGREAGAVPDAGFSLVTLPSAAVAGRGLRGRTRALPVLGVGVLRAHQELRKRGIPAVVSVGGYAAAPAAIAAVALRRPLFLVEPNAVPGRLHRALARFAARIYTLPGSHAFATRPATQRLALGAPIRKTLRDALSGLTRDCEPNSPLRLLILGGSQGARQLNDALIETLPLLERDALEIVHQSGDADQDRVAAAYARSSQKAQVVGFEPDLGARYRWADLALCRAGALTLAELGLAGLPALLVPYPYAADDHQQKNAQIFADAGAGIVLEDKDLEATRLATRLRDLARERDTLGRMARAALRFARPDAAADIVRSVLEVVATRSPESPE